MPMHHFDDSLAMGKEGERIARAVLQQHYPTYLVQEARDMSHQRFGYDFVLKRGTNLTLAEVKTDYHQTPNVAIEIIHRMTDGYEKLGWFYSSKADILLYQRLKLGYYLMLDMAQLRYWLTHLHAYRVVQVENPGMTTECRLVPVTDLQARGAVIHRYGG